VDEKPPKPLALCVGGTAWDGWIFAPYGRARDWRLTDPAGNSFTAQKIAELPYLRLDLDYLMLKIRTLQAQHQALAVYITPDDAATLRAAAEILSRISSPYRRGRKFAGTGQIISDLVAPHQLSQQRTKKAGGI